jgi:hypothetical protein
MIKVENKINLCPNDFGHSGKTLMLEFCETGSLGIFMLPNNFA